MLTFENILELFQEYLLRDPEEEVLPCKRGYVRLTWNKDSRYCVDGILCQTPEELFDLLLTDYQSPAGSRHFAASRPPAPRPPAAPPPWRPGRR